jgi:CDP-glucose 4,6-dehydratase
LGVRPGAVESVAMTNRTAAFWSGKTILMTGHTGFKGAWLAYWLVRMGARVTGVALEPDTQPALFRQLGLAAEIDHRIGDIRDADMLRSIAAAQQPDIVLHLAAQPLVLRGYREPLLTWETNVMGTANLLEAMRGIHRLCAGVIVTTDKVYRNNEWDYGYRECDHLGGHDPYGGSKAAAELVVETWRKSFLKLAGNLRVASARAGNVVGGGDWSANRIVPDIARALGSGAPVVVRRPDSVRPWQHVLEPLGGYLALARALYESAEARFQDAFNFGPSPDAERSVRDLVEESLRHWEGRWEAPADAPAVHEAGRLSLNIDRARSVLGWLPQWDFAETIRRTMAWYRDSMGASPTEIRALVERDIVDYEAAAGGAHRV